MYNIYNNFHRFDIDEVVCDKVFKFFIDHLPQLGYESREGQENLALDISDAMKDEQHILSEAGVGIGKSFAYLVPLMYYNRTFKRPIIISTSTISLQEQLMGDIKVLSRLMMYHADVVLAKGMTHFVCKRRALKYLDENERIKKTYLWLYEWVENEKNGDRTELLEEVEERVWKKINVSGCIFRNCEYYNNCYFVERRNQMLHTSGIILCNHDLLVVDAQKKNKHHWSLLSDNTKYIVVDEAHNLEEKVRNSLTTGWTYNKLVNSIKEALSFIRKSDNYEQYKELVNIIIHSTKRIFNIFSINVKQEINKAEFELNEFTKFKIDISNVKDDIYLIIKYIDRINTAVQLIDTDKEDIQNNIIEDIENIVEFFTNSTDEDSNFLFWLESNNNRYDYKGIVIAGCPKNLSEEINELFFSFGRPKTILTSATLTNSFEGKNQDRYSYIIKNIGFPIDETSFISEAKESPYPYNKNAIIYYKDNMPHPTNERKEFLNECVKAIKELLEATEGKALILFTAKRDLEEVYDKLIKLNLPWKILKQQEGSSQDAIIEEFREEINSVLLGTGIYWEGINISGQALSNLIIVRLPFPVPDPIIEYKRSCSQSPLLEVDVPEMLIKLRQGVGRLIRKETDKGIVSILDSRVSEKYNAPYKEKVWKSLPMKNRTNDINVVKKFVKENMNI